MKKVDLAVIIPGRNEEFMARTIEGVLANKRGNTEVIAVLDGEWADPPIPDHEDVTVVFFGESKGQRLATKLGASLTNAKYIMKLDAHCKVSEGFDVELMKGFEELGDNVTQIPVLYNLHAFNWKCNKCGNEWYQSPVPTHCQLPGEARKDNPNCDNTTDFERVMVWEKRDGRRSECYMFDTEPHFQYHREWMKKHPKGDYVETMSAQGSCFVMTKDKYFDLNIDDESLGSWGSQGIMVACKTWLSGGRLITNRRCWYSHLFRTQGGDFSFPYPLPEKQVQHAKSTARSLFFENQWPGQIHPLSWLIEKFKPLRSWHIESGKPGEKYDSSTLEYVNKKGKEFYERQS